MSEGLDGMLCRVLLVRLGMYQSLTKQRIGTPVLAPDEGVPKIPLSG